MIICLKLFGLKDRATFWKDVRCIFLITSWLWQSAKHLILFSQRLRKLKICHRQTCVQRPPYVIDKLVYNDHPSDPKKWPLLTGGRCSKVIYVLKFQNWDLKMVVTIRRWSLAQVWLYIIEAKVNCICCRCSALQKLDHFKNENIVF